MIKEADDIQRHVNGGVYSIEFRGQSPEFNGIHPAIIIRTLKEKDLYIVIPLTTYTKKRWDKTKRFGFGIRILETNSIVKIDKYKVIHKNQIRNKWVDNITGKPTIVSEETFKKLNRKFVEYNKLTGNVAEKEYGKYLKLFNKVEVDFKNRINLKDGEEYYGLFELQTDSDTEIIYRCVKKDLNMVSVEDVRLIVKSYLRNAFISISDEYLIINYQKPIDNK